MKDIFETLLYVACFIWMVIGGVRWWRKRRAAGQHEKQWPATEGIIQAGQVEQVHGTSGKGTPPPRLPVLEFSYVVAEQHYGGRFALSPYAADADEPIIQMITGKKIKVLYNPAKPEEWLIPDEMISGWRVEQKPAPHFFEIYPQS